jgi:hypothetical protein
MSIQKLGSLGNIEVYYDEYYTYDKILIGRKTNSNSIFFIGGNSDINFYKNLAYKMDENYYKQISREEKLEKLISLTQKL